MLVAQAMFASELLVGLPRSSEKSKSSTYVRTTILIPAHNEADGIQSTLLRLKDVCPEGTEILVIADNCSDDTAGIARSLGVRVAERFDTSHRGKGFALDFGRSHIDADMCDVVIVLDADCVPEPGSITALSASVRDRGVPAQSINLLEPGKGRGPMVEISSFAFMVKNLIRQRGLVRSGGPALLTGTGMAFPQALFGSIPLATSNIVEDLGLTIRLCLDGVRPVLVNDARVWSAPASEKETLIQRERWEHGFVSMAVRYGLPTVINGLLKGNWSAFRLGLHLLVPPLVILFLATAIATIVLAGLTLVGASPVWVLCLTGLTLISLGAVAAIWHREGRKFLDARTLARIPGYMLWKLPLYLKLVKGRQTEWIRTGRGPGTE